MRAIRFTSLTFFLCLAVMAQEISVDTSKTSIDSGLDVAAGETIRLSAEGTLAYPGAKSAAGPEGLARGWRDLVKNYPVNSAGLGALIARIGDSALARPFLVGKKWEGVVPVGGRLFLGINQAGSETAEGKFAVQFERVAPPPALSAASELKLPSFTQELLDQIPLRVVDLNDTPGDRVNFVIIGAQEKVQAALAAAGWVVVDKDVRSAVLAGVLGSLAKQTYITMPMSVLYLFGKPQDFGYAQGDPVRVVAQRHHFRIWKAPFTLEDHIVWAGAGTHDVGFDKDQRDGKVTHRIDSEVDKEREHIGETLKYTGMVAKTEYMTPKNAITEAKTAHGQEFRSDGRTLIIYMKP
jgi:hypothetical protein